MQKYNHQFFIILFLLTGVLCLQTGCIKSNVPGGETTANAAEADADFIVSRLTGKFALDTPEEKTALPGTFTLTFDACIFSKLYQNTALPETQYLLALDKDTIDQERSQIKKGNTRCVRKQNRDAFTGQTDPKAPPACLSNTLVKLPNRKNAIINVKTKQNGCITWTEKYSYPYSPKSQWIVLTRHIESLNPAIPGSFPIPVAVNPWRQKTEENYIQVADYRAAHKHELTVDTKHIKENGLKVLDSARRREKDKKVDIIVENVLFQIDNDQSIKPLNDEKRRKLLAGDIKASVQYSIQDINGDYQYNNISTGEFSLELNLLTHVKSKTTGDMRKTNIAGTNTPPVEFQSDRLITSESFEWIFEHEIASDPIYMHLKLTPKGKTTNRIKPFTGVYKINDSIYDITKTSEKQLTLKREFKKKYDHQVRQYSVEKTSPKHTLSQGSKDEDSKESNHFINCTVNGDAPCPLPLLSDQDNGATRVTWKTDRLFLRHNEVVKEDWLSRIIKSSAEGTLSDKGQPLSEHEIDVEITDFTTGEVFKDSVPTDNSGLFSFNIFTKQHWYKRQRYFLKQVKLSWGYHMNITKLVIINPWDYGFTHGFELTGNKNNRVTCLKNQQEEKQHLTEWFNQVREWKKKYFTQTQRDQNPFKVFLKQKLDKNTLDKQIKTIKNLFCYKESLRKLNVSFSSSRDRPKEIKHLGVFDLFVRFERSLSQMDLAEGQTLTDLVDETFSTSMDTPAPALHIHLLRSITTYPTYTVDSALQRHLKYNMSFKVTPRVVRHDDLARGQQNKGPIRDGVYVFQMAVLKNKQERAKGASNMVKAQGDTARIIPAGDRFSLCDNDNSLSCLEKEDFIIPPQNIPILIRDGMVRTELQLPLTQDQLLFADSKNDIIFRILPADPKSLKCHDNTHCCRNNNPCAIKKSDNKATAHPIDLDKSKNTIKPIDLNKNLYSDMIIETYRAPFILNRWGNWTITSDSKKDENFDKLTKRYWIEQGKKTIDRLYDYMSKFLKDTKKDFENDTSLSPQTITRTSNLMDDWKHENLLNVKDDKLEKLGEWLQAYYSENEGENQKNQTDSKRLITLSHEPKGLNRVKANPQKHRVKGEFTFLNINTMNQLQSIIGEDAQLPKKLCLSIDEKIINDTPTYHTSKLDTCENFSPEDTPTARAGLDFHAAGFAEKEALCILNMDSEEAYGPLSAEKSCATPHAQTTTSQSFLDSINRQIKILQKKNQQSVKNPLPSTITLPFGGAAYVKGPALHPYRLNMPGVVEKESGEVFPSELSSDDIKNIIENKVTAQSFQQDGKLRAFSQALCGFWFDDFYKSYITAQTLMDGLKKKIQEDWYYQIREVLDPNKHNNFDENQELLNTLQKKIQEYEQERDRTGTLKALYHWLKTPDSPADTEWMGFFSDQKGQNPFKFPHYGDLGEYTNPVSEIFQAVRQISEVVVHGFGEHRGPLLERLPNYHHPIKKCLKNPTHFFAFENKILVDDITEDSRQHKHNEPQNEYGGGISEDIRVTEAFFMNTQRDQGANQGSESQMGTSLAIGKGVTIGGGHQYTYRSYEGTGVRRLISFVVDQGITLKAEKSTINIGLKEGYRSCLVIKPRFSAFHRSKELTRIPYKFLWKQDVMEQGLQNIYKKTGMLLCVKGKPNKTITEDYYYISPDYTRQDGKSMDYNNFRNKPFAINLRGTNAYHAFKEEVSCYLTGSTQHKEKDISCRNTEKRFKYLLNQRYEFAGNLKKSFNTPKAFHTTGDMPGVHSFPIEWTEGNIMQERLDETHFLRILSDWQPEGDVPRFLKKALYQHHYQ